MELVRGLGNIKTRHHGCVATIGSFDGVHLGHQSILGRLAEKAAQLHLPAVVITFEPMPREVFARGTIPPRLTRFREKVVALRRYAVDRVICLRFNQALAHIPADDFVKEILIEKLGINCLVIGDDFRFGRARQGDIALLKRYADQGAFNIIGISSFNVDGARVSSTRIRGALNAGDLATAEKLLGRPYQMCGRVAHGDKKGRQLGYPTANIHLHRKMSPLQGVFVVRVFGLDKEPWYGVANVGNRPTVNGACTLLEVHLFDFNENIYGRQLEVEFLQRLRDEIKFASLDELRDAIAQDVQDARAYLNPR